MSNLRKAVFSEFGEIITGKTPSSANPEDFGDDTLFITPSDSFKQKYIDSTQRYLSSEGVKKLKGKLLPANSVLVTCIGSAMGKVAMVRSPSITNQQINSIKINGNFDPEYIYYCLINNYKLLRNAAGGSTALPLLNKTEFELLSCNVHSEKDEQKKISSVLSAIDKKIELNNRINAELEAMAKTLYDYWFVQFDFPDDSQQGQGKPYKTSGGKMVYNPTLKREIPEGWELVPIEHFADVIDPHPSHRAPKEVVNGFPFAGIGDIDEAGNISISKARQIDEEFVLKQEKDYEIGEYSIGFGRVGTVGKVVRLKKQKFRYALSPTLSVINPKKPEYAGYVYTVIKSDEFYKQVIKNTSGTTRPAIGIQLLRKISVLKPSSTQNKMFERYEEITKKLFEKSSIANQENQNLIELRDWLLPMLMNGQVTVE